MSILKITKKIGLFMRKIIKNLYLIVTIIQPTLLFPHSQKSNKPGMIILLNGTSSAGKTTLSQALHAIYENYEVAHIDNYTRRHNHGSFKTKSHGFYTWEFSYYTYRVI